MDPSNSDEVVTASTVEPSSAFVAGGILGAITFLLVSLLFGARVALAIASMALIFALVRRIAGAAVAFAAAAALCGVAVLSSVAPFTWALAGAAAALGAGLAIFARARLRDKVARADGDMLRTAGVSG
ncbi:MAG: hypothetical protein ABI889_03730 [Gemmatimonadota bacterium]